MRSFTLICVATLCSSLSAVAGPVSVGKQTIAPNAENTEEKIVFQPHRAVYEVSLARASAASSIAHLAGRMVYELSGNSCDGYTQNLRFVTRTTNQNGDAQLSDLRSTSWENASTNALRFDVQNFHDADLAEASKGVAKRDAQSGDIRIQLKRPSVKQSTISGTTLFPIAHSKAVLKAARAGKIIFPSAFYDGSETGEKVYQTAAAIGKHLAGVELSTPETEATPHDLAHTVASWPVAMSYYDAAKTNEDGRPSFEMSYRFHLNGVTSKFVIDHGDFAFNGTLIQLAFTAPAGCSSGQDKANGP